MYVATSRKTVRMCSRLPGALLIKSGLGCGESNTRTSGRNRDTSDEACCAFLPTKTIARKEGSKFRRRSREAVPVETSCLLAARMRAPLPIYHGTTFHVIVSSLGIPASRFNSKKFFAVRSELFHEMKPEPTAFEPGASKRKRTWA